MAEDDDQDNEQIDSVSQSASTQPDSPADTKDGLRPSSAMSSMSQHGKKCRHTNVLLVVSQTRGNDFWSMVEKWFTAHMQQDQLGTLWTMPGWTKYVHIIQLITSLLLT